MKLDYLDALSRPAPKSGGQQGTRGTPNVHEGCSVPLAVPLRGTTGDNSCTADANPSNCPPMSPSCPPPQETCKATVYAAVPRVPPCPPKNEDVLIFRWLRNRCTRSWQAWGSEKSLWGDYCAWCEQHKQSVCRRELFCATMNESFTREDDGWQGVMLAIDDRATKYIM